MKTAPMAGALMALALTAPAAPAAVDGPVTRFATAGGRADVLTRDAGAVIVAWESGPDVHVCRIAAFAGTCTAGSEKTLAPAAAAGTSTSRPFLLALSGGRIAVVRGECCPQHTYRWVSADEAGTFAAAVDFASVVPSDQGAVAGTDDSISLLADPPRYQLAASAGAGKATTTVTLDGTAAPGAHAISVDPATNRPFAAWSTATDTLFAGASSAAPTSAAAWMPRVTLTGSTGVRLSGGAGTWVHDGRHEIAGWNGTAFSPGVPLADAAPDAGEADLATDGAGGVHLVYAAAGGALCYVFAPAGGVPGAPVLIGRDTEGAAGLSVSATSQGAGRVVFTTPAAGGPVSIAPLATGTLTPNVCGLAPSDLALARAAGRARVTVALDPHGQATSYHLDYGPTTGYGTSTADVAVPSAVGPLAATVDLPGLDPGSVYHVRLVAANATGATASGDLAIRTPERATRALAGQVIRFARRCAERRLRVSFAPKEGARPVLAVIRVRERKPLRLGAKRLAAGGLTLTGLPRRHVALSVRVRLADGRILGRSRAFARCG